MQATLPSSGGAAAAAGPNGEIWTTVSVVAGLPYHHVLVPLLREDYELTVAELHTNDAGDATAAAAAATLVTALTANTAGQLVIENAFDFEPSTATYVPCACMFVYVYSMNTHHVPCRPVGALVLACVCVCVRVRHTHTHTPD